MESLSPFLQGSCIPCNMPVYPGAPPDFVLLSAPGGKCTNGAYCTVARKTSVPAGCFALGSDSAVMKTSKFFNGVTV